MSTRRPQTAIQGVAVSTSLNLAARALNFVRQVLITGYFGLTLHLDAFYVAVAMTAIFINSFGDVFDSAGIPTLIRTREREGEEAFRRLSGSIFTFSVLLSGGLTVLLLLASPLARYLVPGFSAAALAQVRENLLFLVPFALAYLPYHCLGSFFRSVREFHVFYVGEVLVMATGLAVVFSWRSSVYVVPLSISAGYAGGLLFFILRAWGRFRFRGGLGSEGITLVRRTVARMLPMYGLSYGTVVIEKYFGSFLEAGAISALSYGFILATTVPAVMNVENIFITPLSEESDRGALLARIFSGVVLVSVPILAFVLVFADALIHALFGRGAFTPRAAELTADALRFYAVGIPALFVLPLGVRTLQVFSSLRWVAAMGAVGLVVDAVANVCFSAAQLGVRGIALAWALGTTTCALSGLWFVSRVGVRVRYREPLEVLPGATAATAIALGVAYLFRPGWHPVAELVAQGTGFVLIYTLLASLLPGAEMDRVRALVLESFPWLRRSR